MIRPKVGDTVTLKPVLVRETNNEGFWTGKDGTYSFFRNEEIDSIKPRPFKVGDKVETSSPSHRCGTILAIHGKQAWVLFADGHKFTNEIEHLKHVEDQ